jgi:hypothetical protein
MLSQGQGVDWGTRTVCLPHHVLSDSLVGDCYIPPLERQHLYTAGFRVASSHSGSTVQVYVDDGTTPVAAVNVPNTGDWPVFQTVSVPVTLPVGQHRLRLAFPTDYVNITGISFA